MNKKIFTGGLFIIAGIGLVIDRLGYLQGVSTFNLLASGYMTYLIVKGISRRNIFSILIPLSLLGVIYWDFIGPSSFNPWTLVWAAILVSIGISIIFKPKRRFKMHWDFKGNGEFKDRAKQSYEEGEESIHIGSTFSECIRYLQGEDIKNVKLDNTFGSMKIYFDNISPKDDYLVVDIDATFSGVELYVPRDWEVRSNLEATFGGVKERNKSDNEKTKTLILQGDATFAGVEIIYI